MKILEAQSATLSNYEVFTHLTNQKARYEAGAKKRRGPGNLETVVRELLDYLRAPPSPLAEIPLTYSPSAIKTLLTRLRPYDLTKAELIMILNLRPTSELALVAVIEEMSMRFSESQHLEIVSIVGEVLGMPDVETERKRMRDSAIDARERQKDLSVETDAEEAP